MNTKGEVLFGALYTPLEIDAADKVRNPVANHQIAAAHTRKKKTYNNVVSAVRTAFKFGYRDLPGKFNPALALTTFRITKKDRPPVDPFSVAEAEAIISASHGLHGESYGNSEEFRFFTGLRQSEQFALEVGDCDLAKGSISVTKAVVLSQKKNQPGSRNQSVPASPGSHTFISWRLMKGQSPARGAGRWPQR